MTLSYGSPLAMKSGDILQRVFVGGVLGEVARTERRDYIGKEVAGDYIGSRLRGRA